MRNSTFGGRRTPSPPTNPPEPKYTHSSHEVHPDDAVFDVDGPSRAQAEQYDGDILTVIIEGVSCRRDGCEASETKYHIYMYDDLSARVQQAIEYASDYPLEYAAVNIEIVDYDHKPIVGVQFGSDVLGYIYPSETEVESDLGGSCHGRVDEATRLGI